MPVTATVSVYCDDSFQIGQMFGSQRNVGANLAVRAATELAIGLAWSGDAPGAMALLDRESAIFK